MTAATNARAACVSTDVVARGALVDASDETERAARAMKATGRVERRGIIVARGALWGRDAVGTRFRKTRDDE